MSDLISSLQSGQSVPSVNRTGREITDNDVANTKNGSRHPAQTSQPPSLAAHGDFTARAAVGSGIARAENSLITNQLVSRRSGYGEASAQAGALAKLEGIICTPASDLCSTMAALFDGRQAFGSPPEPGRERENVLATDKQLTDTFRQMDRELAEVQAEIDQDIASAVDDLNKQLMQIGDVDTRIVTREAGGIPADTLRDERNRLLQALAETVGIQYNEMDTGGVSVQLPSGAPLVMSGDVGCFSSECREGKVLLSLSHGATSTDLGTNDLGGKIGGLMTVRDETIEKTRTALDQLAEEIAARVDTIDSSQVVMDGNTGQDFFNGATSSNGSTTLLERYRQLAAGIRIEVSRNTTALESDEDSLIQLQNLQDTIAGASPEEEMMLLSQYQGGYQTAVKSLSLVQGMLDSLLARD